RACLRLAKAGGKMRRPRHLERRAEAGGERLDAAPVVKPVYDERRLSLRQWHHLEGNLGEQTERAEGARHQARQIKAGDVLHHPPAGLHRLAAPIDEARAEEGIAAGAGLDAARARKIRGRDATDRGLASRAEKRTV